MKYSPCSFSSKQPPGRPRKVELTPDQARALAAIYLETNRAHDAGSMEMAWVLFVEGLECNGWKAHPEFAHTVAHHRLASALPVAALEVMRRARALVGAKRGGAKRLLAESPSVRGTMRVNAKEKRRLYAGERYSVDDLTRNVGCWIPWPWGGCKCSDKFKVKLGRWQTLVVHDDASGMIIAVKSVFRFEQSYRGSDAASLILSTEAEVGMRDDGKWVIEGGVWRSAQMMAALDGRWQSAMGRPNQKLVERWFNAMQTRDSVHLGDMGRIRGENLENNKDYLAGRDGARDPRKKFLEFEAAQERLMETIQWLNGRKIVSRDLYGEWVPEERWYEDIAAMPLTLRDPANMWAMAPERRTLTVSKHAQVSCTALGPMGVPMKIVFWADWLWQFSGKSVDVYFDPMGDWPLEATIADPKTRKMLGKALCQDAYGQGLDRDVAMQRAIRKSMMSELRVIVGTQRRVTETRTPSGLDISSSRGDGSLDFPARSEHGQLAGSGEEPGRGKRDHEPIVTVGGQDMILPVANRSLSRRAAAAREQMEAANW